MIQYILKSLAYGLLVLLGVVLIIFFLFNVMPVNSARLTMGQRGDVSSLEAIEKELGLDLPVHQRLIKYIGEISPLWVHERTTEEQQRLNYTALFPVSKSNVFTVKVPYFGKSYQSGRPVTEILAEKIPSTIILAVAAMLLASVIGIFMGIVAAINHNRFWDNMLTSFSVLGISQPSYFVGIIFAYLFGVLWSKYTGLSHVGHLYEYGIDGETIVWKNLILPAVALGIRPIAIIMQLTRSSMLDVLSQDYIRTARAKGMGKGVVLFKHALRNALNPVVTSISGWFAAVLTGAYFVEYIFSFKGLGYETVQSLLNFDFPVVMGSVLFTATIFVVINIFTDITYGFLDPRISVKANK